MLLAVSGRDHPARQWLQTRVNTVTNAGPRRSTNLLSERSTKGCSGVEVKIGMSDSPRELIFNSSETAEEVEKQVRAAWLEGQEVLSLSDERGRKFLVNAARINYVEIGTPDTRRVGFG